MLLRLFVASYIQQREISREYADSLKAIEREFSAWLNRPAKLSDLTDEKVNRWLIDICNANGRAKVTLSNKRTLLLVLWRAAWMDERVKLPPRRVRRISAPAPVVTAWDRPNVTALLAAAKLVEGEFKRSKVSRAAFWRAFILCGYYSGLRLGDLCRLKWSDVRPDGTIQVVQHKTGSPLVTFVRDNGLEAMEAIRSRERPRVFGDCLCRRRIMDGFIALAKRAGLSGGTRMLRRTGATQCEMIGRGNSKDHLGHKTAGIAERHYIDASQLAKRKVTPPRVA